MSISELSSVFMLKLSKDLVLSCSRGREKEMFSYADPPEINFYIYTQKVKST